ESSAQCACAMSQSAEPLTLASSSVASASTETRLSFSQWKLHETSCPPNPELVSSSLQVEDRASACERGIRARRRAPARRSGARRLGLSLSSILVHVWPEGQKGRRRMPG